MLGGMDTYGRVETRHGRTILHGERSRIVIAPARLQAALAVTQRGPSKAKRSLQLFDRAGTLCHELRLRDEGRFADFDVLAELHAKGPLAFELPASRRKRRYDQVLVAGALRELWGAGCKDDEIAALLEDADKSRAWALRTVGSIWTERVVGEGPLSVMRRAVAGHLTLTVTLRHDGVEHHHVGLARRLHSTGGRLVLRAPGFSARVEGGRSSSTWLVRRPTKQGVETSLECHDSMNRLSVVISSTNVQGPRQEKAWNDLLADLEIMNDRSQTRSSRARKVEEQSQ